MKPSQFFSLALVLVTTLACQGATPTADSGRAGSGGGEQSGAGDSAGGGARAGADDGAGATAGAVAVSEGSFGASDCRSCLAEACASPEAECASEPGCGGYLDCLDACPAAASGAPEATCVMDCALPEAAATRGLAERVVRCRESGDGLTCDCGQPKGTSDVLVQECGPSQETVACFVCEDENCCNTYADCAADSECVAYKDCFLNCTSTSTLECELSCGEQHPAGFEKGLRRFACIYANCFDEGECSDTPPDACDKCTRDYCGDEFVACWASPACQRTSACVAACSSIDSRCLAACFEPEPEGAELLQGYAECLLAQCPSECG